MKCLVCLACRILPCLVKLPGWITHTCGSNPLVLSPLHSRVLLTTLLRLISWKDTNKLFGPKANSFLYPHFLDVLFDINPHIAQFFFLKLLPFSLAFTITQSACLLPPYSFVFDRSCGWTPLSLTHFSSLPIVFPLGHPLFPELKPH